MFVDLRKRFGADQINEINETIMGLVTEEVKGKKEDIPPNNNIPDVESSELKHTNESIKNQLKNQPKNQSMNPLRRRRRKIRLWLGRIKET